MLLPSDLSGEDPFLGYTLSGPAISGIQSAGVIANAKHFVANNRAPSQPADPHALPLLICRSLDMQRRPTGTRCRRTWTSGHSSRCTCRRSRGQSRRGSARLCAAVSRLELAPSQQHSFGWHPFVLDGTLPAVWWPSDNKINDRWSCENPTTLGYLKKDLNFTGWVMSDW